MKKEILAFLSYTPLTERQLQSFGTNQKLDSSSGQGIKSRDESKTGIVLRTGYKKSGRIKNWNRPQD